MIAFPSASLPAQVRRALGPLEGPSVDYSISKWILKLRIGAGWLGKWKYSALAKELA